MDLSGSLQGAGGVGGLVVATEHDGSTSESYFPTFDGNGNVSEYLDDEGAVVAHFEYDPFGNTVKNTDTNNKFAYRFSTKPLDLTTGLYYYGYRWYDPTTGRWPSRDLIGESGGINLYAFVGNDGVNENDVYGLWDKRIHKLATAKWGIEAGLTPKTAKRVGEYDNGVDLTYFPLFVSNWAWHFNRNLQGKDSRQEKYEEYLQIAKDHCDFTGKQNDDPKAAAKALGTALHPKQDMSAHGDYNWIGDMPTPSLFQHGGNLYHNAIMGWGTRHDPDDPDLDADTASRFPIKANGGYFTLMLDVSNGAIGFKYVGGGERVKKTKEHTKAAYKAIQDFIATNGGEDDPNCKCRKEFGVPLN